MILVAEDDHMHKVLIGQILCDDYGLKEENIKFCVDGEEALSAI